MPIGGKILPVNKHTHLLVTSSVAGRLDSPTGEGDGDTFLFELGGAGDSFFFSRFLILGSVLVALRLATTGPADEDDPEDEEEDEPEEEDDEEEVVEEDVEE